MRKGAIILHDCPLIPQLGMNKPGTRVWCSWIRAYLGGWLGGWECGEGREGIKVADNSSGGGEGLGLALGRGGDSKSTDGSGGDDDSGGTMVEEEVGGDPTLGGRKGGLDGGEFGRLKLGLEMGGLEGES